MPWRTLVLADELLLLRGRGLSVEQAAHQLGVSRATAYNALRARRIADAVRQGAA